NALRPSRRVVCIFVRRAVGQARRNRGSRELGEGLLASTAVVFPTRGVYQFLDGRRSGSCARELSGKLRSPRTDQTQVRSDKPVSTEPEHQAVARVEHGIDDEWKRRSRSRVSLAYAYEAIGTAISRSVLDGLTRQDVASVPVFNAFLDAGRHGMAF